MMTAEDPGLYYAEEIVVHPLITSNTSINGPSSDLLLSGMKAREPETMSKSRIMKNIIMISSSLFIFFLGFQSLQNLQSTMNSEQGIGMESQAISFGTSMITSLLFPDLLIKTFGAKRTMVCMIVSIIPFFIANFHPVYEVIIPTSVLMGAAMGPLNAVGAFYINEMAQRYLKLTPTESLEVILARFYGVLSFFLENTQIWGNLITYEILRPGMIPILNHTNASCGIHFENNDSNPNLQPPPEDQRTLLISIFILSAVIAATLMGLFLDKLENDIDKSRRQNKCALTFQRLLAAAKQAYNPHQVLLLPITVLLGLELGFYTGDVTKAYIACSWGVHHVGFVTVCFGVCGAVMALLVGPLVKCFSQMAVLLLAAAAHGTAAVLLFFWTPSPDSASEYFVFAGVWGMGDAIWWSQVTALYGLMFPNDREAAFSNLYFWSFLGFFLSYSYANYFSVAVKIYILLGFLVTGIAGYLIGQIKLRCVARREYLVISGEEE